MHQPTFQKHLFYWILPVFVTLSCVFIYFYDMFGWSYLMASPVNREFGVVENLQLMILGTIIFLAFKGIKNNPNRAARQCFRLLIGLTIVIFLEEIDYGLHYWDYLNLTPQESTSVMQIDYNVEVRNIHNNGQITNISKLISYALIIILFVLIPLLPASIKERYGIYKYVSPSRFIVTTAVSLLIVNNIALYLYRSPGHLNNSLNGNISEFEEIMTYYIFMLYTFELTCSDKLSQFFNYYKAKQKKAIPQFGYTPYKSQLNTTK